MVVGGRDAWKVADRLKVTGTPVILKLNFTDPSDREATLPIRVREDYDRLRKLEAGCAAALHKAGVKFAFSTVGIVGQQPQDKFRENLKKAIDAGLPADAALAALTTNAAEILGVSPQVGRVTAGLAGHLTVCEGDFQNPATKVKYVFADGVRIDPSERTETPTAINPDAPGLNGSVQSGNAGDRNANRAHNPPGRLPIRPRRRPGRRERQQSPVWRPVPWCRPSKPSSG
jgi:hypothetical protein